MYMLDELPDYNGLHNELQQVSSKEYDGPYYGFRVSEEMLKQAWIDEAVMKDRGVGDEIIAEHLLSRYGLTEAYEPYMG